MFNYVVYLFQYHLHYIYQQSPISCVLIVMLGNESSNTSWPFLFEKCVHTNHFI